MGHWPDALLGGSWNEIEGSRSLREPTPRSIRLSKQAKAGRFEDANALRANSWDQWWDLNHRFGNMPEGIQRGGNRVVTGIKLL